MELRTVILGQAIQFTETTEAKTSKRMSPVPLIRAMQDRYGFVEVPTKVSDLDFAAGVKFLQGYFKGTIITRFQVYDNGLLCEAAADNSLCERFVDEVLDSIPDEFGIPLIRRPRKAFQSTVEVTLTKDVSVRFNSFTKAGAMIGSALESYGQPNAPFHFSGIEMHLPDNQNELGHPEFQLAKRKGHAYEENVYFSKAPLRTEDHLAILTELERII